MVGIIEFIKKNYKQLLVLVLLWVVWQFYGGRSFEKKTFFFIHHLLLFKYLPLHVIAMYVASLAKGGSNKTTAIRNVILGILFPAHIFLVIALLIIIILLTNSTALNGMIRDISEILIFYTYSLSGLLFIFYRDKIVSKSWFPKWKNYLVVFLGGITLLSIFVDANIIQLDTFFQRNIGYFGRSFLSELFYVNSLSPDSYFAQNMDSKMIASFNFDYTVLAIVQLFLFTFLLWSWNRKNPYRLKA